MIEHLSFDLDGVLIDSEDIHFQSLIEAIFEITHLSLFEIQAVIKKDGSSTKSKLKKLVEMFHLSVDDIDKIDKLKQNKTLYALNNIKPNANLENTLNILYNKYKITLVSNSRPENVSLILKKLKIKKFFHGIFSPEDGFSPKPSGDMYLHAINFVNSSSEKTIIFEDSLIGIEAAKNSNAHVVCVNNVYSLTLSNINYAVEQITNNINSHGGEWNEICKCRI